MVHRGYCCDCARGGDLGMTEPLIQVEHTWDMCYIPSERPLYAILVDVVQHGVDFPTHGSDCVCMDAFSYEVHRHVARALGPGRNLETYTDPVAWQKCFDARMRIKHILRMASNRL
jgi:hypothetical protein